MKTRKAVLAVVGMAGSGKSEVCRYLNSLGYPVIRFGQIIVGEVEERGLEINPTNEQLVREELRSILGMDACAIISIPKIDQLFMHHDLVVVDGLYSWSEYKTLNAHFNENLVLLAVLAPRSTRYRRLAMRKVRPLTAAEAEKRDRMEIERIEKGGPIAFADFVILNDSTKRSLSYALRDLLPRITKSG